MKLYSLKFQIILLTLVPLACLMVLSAVLLTQMNLVIKSVEEETRSWKHVNTSYKLESEVIEAFCDLRTSTDDDGMVDRDESLRRFSHAKKTLAEIVNAYRDSPDKLRQAKAIQTFWHQKAEPFIAWFIEAQSHGELHWKRVNTDFPFRLIALCDEFLTRFTTLIRAERSSIEGDAVNQRWEQFSQLPYIAIGISILFAILQGTALAFTIKRPLSRIGENCRRMAANVQLLPPLRGRDELSELDRLFHAMAQSVSSAVAGEIAMIENARDLICTLSADGTFVKSNNSSLQLIGYEPEELLHKSLLDICRSEDTVKADDEIQTLVQRSEMRTFDLTLVRKDGTNVETRWSCVWSERDNVLFAVARDVTEEKNVERLKQDFVDMISHDLRSPLTSMLGSLSMIEQGAKGPLPEPAQNEIGSAVQNVERLVDFINDLLDYQKLKSGRMQLERVNCNLNELVNDALEAVKDAADLKQLRFVLPEEPGTIYGDKNKLQQVLVNLLANAVRSAQPNTDIEVVAAWTSSTFEIRVIDSGPGVPEDYREQVFEAFQQIPTQRTKEGTGLGLAICKLIVEAHGGQIGVSGDSGNIFWFTLPRR